MGHKTILRSYPTEKMILFNYLYNLTTISWKIL
jgi:hypothetical protein